MKAQLTKIRQSEGFQTAWLVWFLVWFGQLGFSQQYSYLRWKCNLGITQETEIWHADSTHKKQRLNGFWTIWLIWFSVWFVWFGFSQPYSYLSHFQSDFYAVTNKVGRLNEQIKTKFGRFAFSGQFCFRVGLVFHSHIAISAIFSRIFML